MLPNPARHKVFLSIFIVNPPAISHIKILSFQFKVTAGPSFMNGTVAIDDIDVKDDCAPLGSCTFEDGMCLWSNEPDTEDLQWLRGSGEVTDVAPVNDVTFGNLYGTYLYVHVIKTWNTQPKSAKLLSPYFHRTERRCFSYYHYRGGSEFDGALSVSMYRDDFEPDGLQHFTTENIGLWVNAHFEIDQALGEGKYQIVFEGELTET